MVSSGICRANKGPALGGKSFQNQNQKSGSVSRVLSWAAIYLGQPLPIGSSDLPAGIARAKRRLFGLAGGGVCRAGIVTNPAVRSYRTISPLPAPISRDVGCVFSVALSLPRTYLPRLSSQKSLSAISNLSCALAVAMTKQIGAGRWPLAITVPCPARTFLPALKMRTKRPPDPLF